MFSAKVSAFFQADPAQSSQIVLPGQSESSKRDADLSAILPRLASLLKSHDTDKQHLAARELERLLDAAIFSPITLHKYADPTLQHFWADCFIAREETKSQFRQKLESESRAFSQLFSSYVMEKVSKMHRGNNQKSSLAYVENYNAYTLRLLRLAAKHGSFAAAIRLQFYYLSSLSMCTSQNECCKIISATIQVAGDAYRRHGMPGALLSAEACYYSALALQKIGGNEEAIIQYFQQTLLYLYSARDLQSTSTIAIYNAYRGLSLQEASEKKLMTAKMQILLKEDNRSNKVCWDQFIDECASLILNLSPAQIESPRSPRPSM